MDTLSEEVQKLIVHHTKYKEETGSDATGDTEKIHVDEIASKIATFYDKFRNLIQYHEAHLLRRDTIERNLRRRILLKTSESDFAEAFIKDLIRSGHLPNDFVPEKKIADIRIILDNLLYLLKQEGPIHLHGKRQPSDWLIRIFVPPLEEELFPPPENRFIGEMMYEIMRSRLVVKKGLLEDEEASTQLFIATQRSLFRLDNDQLQYMLLKFLYPQWGKMSEEELSTVVPTLGSLRANTEKVIKNPVGAYFLKLCRKEKIAFQLVGDLVFTDVPLEEDFEDELRSLYEERSDRISHQLRKLALLSVISFLISKVAIALAIEIPLDRAFSWPLSPTNTAINVLFPPLLMLTIVAFVRPPSRKNFAIVSREVKQILSPENPRNYVLPVPPKISKGSTFAIYVAYAAALGLVFYGMVHYLSLLQFSPFSIAIFILFTSMIIATGVKINNRGKEMSMEKERSTLLGFFVDLMLIPFTALGRWIIAGLSKFNVVVLIFDFFIELPLGFFVEFLENFRKFIKTKKEELG